METLKELREMSDEQLAVTLSEAKENLFRLRVQAQTERLDAPSEVRRNRKLVARVKTLQTERLTAGKSVEASPDPAEPATG